MNNTTGNDKFINLKKLSDRVLIPRFISNLFRTSEAKALLGEKPNKGFDSLTTVLALLNNKIIIMQNIINDNTEAINRNKNKIETKNDKINFLSFSKNYPDNIDYKNNQNIFLKKTLPINTDMVSGIIADEDSGIEIVEVKENGSNFIKFNFDENKIKDIKFISAPNSSIKIVWDEQSGGFKVEQNTILLYESSKPETEIIIDHNLGTKAIDIKVFKILNNDIDLKYPIVPGLEFPSDNQVRVYLTTPLKIHVLISRL